MRIERAAALLVLCAVCGCRADPQPSAGAGRISRAREGPARALLALSPAQTRAGETFQKQSTGEAALAVLGAGFSPGDVILWDARPLRTSFAHSRLLTAIVPAELIEKPRDVEVTVENPAHPALARLRATFRILPHSAVAARPGA